MKAYILAIIPIFVLVFALIPYADASPALRDPSIRGVGCWWCEDAKLVESVSPYGASPLRPVSEFSTTFDSFSIDVADEVTCDNWIPVYGLTPEFGLLTFAVLADGKILSYSNVSHFDTTLINYFYLPCTGDSEGELIAIFHYNDPHDHEKAPNTKVNQLFIDRTWLTEKDSFKIVQ